MHHFQVSALMSQMQCVSSNKWEVNRRQSKKEGRHFLKKSSNLSWLRQVMKLTQISWFLLGYGPLFLLYIHFTGDYAFSLKKPWHGHQFVFVQKFGLNCVSWRQWLKRREQVSFFFSFKVLQCPGIWGIVIDLSCHCLVLIVKLFFPKLIQLSRNQQLSKGSLNQPQGRSTKITNQHWQ